MISQDHAKTLTENFFQTAGDEELEVILRSFQVQSTRFAENAITQNVSIGKAQHFIRMQKDGKQARVQVDHLETEDIPKILQQLRERIAVAPKDEALIPLTKTPLQEVSSPGFSESTYKQSPEERADAICKIAAKMKENHNLATGCYNAEAGSVAYANSNGVFGYYQKTVGSLDVTTTSSKEDTEGKALAYHQDTDAIDAVALAEESIEIAEQAKKAKSIEPGYYTVVLHPKAVGDLIFFISKLCFLTLPYQEGTSFLTGKLGEQLFSEKFELEENAYHPELGGMPFDFEGVPKQKLKLIEAGIPTHLVYDRLTAKKAQMESTGHSLPQPNESGPYPLDLVMKGGDTSIEEMIESTSKGLFVRQFHYTNTLNPLELKLTGMTRAGLFWIENGKIAYPVKNLRFTISLLDVFKNIEMLGPTQLIDKTLFWESIIVPAMKVNRFHFTSQTDF